MMNTISVRDYGATGDGNTLDTSAIQAAVDACANMGGGTVSLPTGTYLTGTIILKRQCRLSPRVRRPTAWQHFTGRLFDPGRRRERVRI